MNAPVLFHALAAEELLVAAVHETHIFNIFVVFRTEYAERFGIHPHF